MTVARALIDLLLSLELSDEESVSLEAATAFVEDASATLSALSRLEREELTSIIRQMENEATMEERREVLRSLPEDIGLLD
ncbi:hypothetical protein DEJ48_36580 [Streptomyces venezuelae]|uniref:Uncharacterized protein n=2 Tax=Streptomyces venezuelae TaxID=54571 RepID=A0A5P2C673_STRVZ|nr:hypothetical protein DEJ48_36580 [Streptomyces venezuelae]